VRDGGLGNSDVEGSRESEDLQPSSTMTCDAFA
jgi:hypothetical protein